MQGALHSVHAPLGWRAPQRTHEWGGEVRERAPRPAALHGFQQRHGAGREGGGAANAQRLVEHRVHHAGRQLAAPPNDLLGDRKPADFNVAVPILAVSQQPQDAIASSAVRHEY